METKEYEIKEGSFCENLDSFSDLLKEHWEEVAKNKEVMILSPDRDKYKALEDSGSLKTLIAYSNGVPVGYSVNIVGPHLHYSSLIVGYNDLLFILPEFRNSPLGLKLIRQTEKFMKTLGVSLLLWHAKEGTSLDKILPALRYKTQEIIYSKQL